MLAAHVAAAGAFAVVLGKKGDEVASLGIDPEIDGLVADAKPLAIPADATSDQLGRPAQAQLGLDIAANGFGLETESLTGSALAHNGAELSGPGEVAALVERRAIAPKFPRKGRGTALEDPGDLPQRLALGSKDSQTVALISRQMCVVLLCFGSHKHLRYRTSGVALPC